MCFIRLLVCPEHSQLEVVQIEFCNLARRPDAISHDQAGASFAIGKNRAVSLDKAKTLCPRGVRLLAAVKMHSCTGGEPLPLGLWNDGAGNEAQYNGPIPEQRIKEGLDHVSQADGSPNPANPVPDSDAAQQTRETGGNTAHDSLSTNLLVAFGPQFNTGVHTKKVRINKAHTNRRGITTRDVTLNGVRTSGAKATRITSPLLSLLLANKPDPNRFEVIGTVHAEGVRIRLNGRPASQIPTQDLADLLLGLHNLPPDDRLDERVFVLQGSLVEPR